MWSQHQSLASNSRSRNQNRNRLKRKRSVLSFHAPPTGKVRGKTWKPRLDMPQATGRGFLLTRFHSVHLLKYNLKWRKLALAMFRIAAITLVALAAFDYFLLDGRYLRSVEAMVHSVIHFAIG